MNKKRGYAFGHEFEDFNELIDSLVLLEKEGYLYQHMWDDVSQSYKYYRIQLSPSEIFQYVESHVAKGEFDRVKKHGGSFKKALKAISNKEIAKRVESFGHFGKQPMKSGEIIDIRGCFASFLPPDLDKLIILGQVPTRLESVFKIGVIDKMELVYKQLDQFPLIAKFLSARGHKRINYEIINEYDVQDLLYACFKSVFDDVRLEEWTVKHGGKAKRVDIVMPEIDTIIEVKIVRSKSHSNLITDELKIDIESYHVHPNCKNLIFFIYDPKRFIIDPKVISTELTGTRVNKISKFEVKVFIR